MTVDLPVPPKLKEFGHGQQIYFWHVIALITPGVNVPHYDAHQIEPGPLEGWSRWDRALMIDEGRRQIDRQASDMQEVRGRAQWLFTVGLAATIAIGGVLRADKPTHERLGLFIASLLMLVYGLAGAAGIMATKADFGTIDAAALSHQTLPTERYLASAYSRIVKAGENTVATRITIFRQAVVWIILGAYTGLIAALV